MILLLYEALKTRLIERVDLSEHLVY